MQTDTGKKMVILKVATDLFKRYGYAKTSLEDIAKEAQLGKGTIYYYFESKEEIFFSIGKAMSQDFFRQLKELVSQAGSFEEKFTIAVSMPIKLIMEHAPILLEVQKSLPAHFLNKLAELKNINRDKVVELLRDILKEGIEEGIVDEHLELERAANILYDWFLVGDTNIIIHYPDEFVKKAEKDYEWIIQLILHGLSKRGADE